MKFSLPLSLSSRYKLLKYYSAAAPWSMQPAPLCFPIVPKELSKSGRRRRMNKKMSIAVL